MSDSYVDFKSRLQLMIKTANIQKTKLQEHTMLKLTYSYKSDKHQKVTVLGDPEGILDLLWQLTHNYEGRDGCAIGDIVISNLDGMILDKKEFMSGPYAWNSSLSKIHN